MSETAVIEGQQALPTIEAPAQQVVTTPGQVIAAMLSNGAGVEDLKTFMEIQLQWDANEARKSFVRAKAAFKAKCPQVERTAYSEHNDFWHDTIAGIASACDPLLAEQGLSYEWKTDQADQIRVDFVLSHIDGHVEVTTLKSMPDTSGGKNSIQAIGSAVEYLKRYTMRAGLGIAVADKDHEDDGRSAPDSRIPAEEVNRISNFLHKHRIAEEEFLVWLRDTQQVHRIDQLNIGQLAGVWVALNRSQAQKVGGTSTALADGPVDHGLGMEYVKQLKELVFDQDDAGIRELMDEMDNDMRIFVNGKLESPDRTYIRNVRHGERSE